MFKDPAVRVFGFSQRSKYYDATLSGAQPTELFYGRLTERQILALTHLQVELDVNDHKLLIGVGGTGKTSVLKNALETTDVSSNQRCWLTATARRFPTLAELEDKLKHSPRLIVVDELQWFSDSALQLLIDRLESEKSPTIWATKRPWPSTETNERLSLLLCANDAPTITGLLSIDEYRPLLASFLDSAITAETLTWFHQQTAGSLGLTSDIVATQWQKKPTEPPPHELVYLLNQRLARCEPEVEELTQAMALHPQLKPTVWASNLTQLEVEDDDSNADPSDAVETSLRSSGLVSSEGTLIPLAASAIESGLTTRRRQRICDQLALNAETDAEAISYALRGATSDPAVAAVLLKAGERTWWKHPKQTAKAAETAQRIVGSSSEGVNLAEVAQFRLLPVTSPASSPLVRFGQTLRDLRWDDANKTTSQLPPTCRSLVQLLTGDFAAASTQSTDPTSDVGEANGATETLDGLQFLVDGRNSEALRRFTQATTVHDRLTHPSLADPFLIGFRPHELATLSCIAIGDLDAARHFVTQAEASPSLDPAGHRTFTLLSAFLHLLQGNYALAQEATTDGSTPDSTGWSVSERLFWSALNAGLARRSGDTTKLRQAWGAAEDVMLTISPSWLHTEILHDLLVAGTRLGKRRRVGPVATQTAKQLEQSRNPDLLVASGWTKLQMGIAEASGVKPKEKDSRQTSSTNDAITSAAKFLEQQQPIGLRAKARCAAAPLWAQIATGNGPTMWKDSNTESSIVDTAQQLSDFDDPWQASRLLGQAALDCPAPKTARRLLEQARDVVAAVSEPGSDGFAEWGFSEREAEVAVLVADGMSYKQVGERLFISPKTVEHHVARIRQKVGASSRSEMLKKISSRMG